MVSRKNSWSELSSSNTLRGRYPILTSQSKTVTSNLRRGMSDDLGTKNLRLEREGPIAWCIIDRP